MKQKLAMLEQMAAVTEAQYLKEHAKIKPILDHEARLRGQLTKLEAQVREARTEADGDMPMKALGADLLWEGWHLNTRRNLNMQLAQVTARKLMAMDRLRKTFGRKTAVSDMEKAEKLRRKAAKAKTLEEQLLSRI
ncbi:hypothetical protein [Phaeobacter sp. 11ANDIMAR09]|uniref:hypothetical protein n=1 Tax=Phaeobacter sp. 11ANDIMAR09 TaxID=1225647 RepID=UPI0006C8B4BC|nr:hypothetical protein [Phaeobacter sp. 11ANDIMAR09]KPD14317.1 hypothetical protein AN476_00840 [Phaeobacter sp. 11ANDIMAR09]